MGEQVSEEELWDPGDDGTLKEAIRGQELAPLPLDEVVEDRIMGLESGHHG